MNHQEFITVEIAYVSASKQHLIASQVPKDCIIRTAIEASGILALCPELNIDKLNVGIFSKPRSLDWVLAEGDRIEIYRELYQDPKVARLKRAKQQKQAKDKLKNKK